MLFHNRQRNIESIIPKLTINEHIIERVTDFNFLGLTFDQHMSWNAHINKISVKMTKTIGILSRLKHFLPQKILLMIYNSLILPHIQYGILCWGYKIDRILKLQKRALRLITNSKYNAHSEPLLKTLKCLNVSDLFKLKILKFYYKLEKGTIPHYFQNMFITITSTHSYHTRFRHLPDLPQSITTTGSNCIRYTLPKYLLDTPACIKDKVATHSPQGFSNYIKQYLINQYSETCTIVNCYICNQVNV